MKKNWTKILEFFDHSEIKTDWRTSYLRYRLGRLKHQYWLDNRKNPYHAVVNEYDYRILKNCQPGHTVFFGSSGYYLKDIWPDITVVEMHPVVKSFYPSVFICDDRDNIDKIDIRPADNFAVVNNRADLWTELENITGYCRSYTKIMNPGCRFFYSFRDTQIVGINRLKTDMEQHFLNWAHGLTSLHLDLVWHSIDFRRKIADQNGCYDQLENPDTTNGNLKFMFVYKGDPWKVI